MKPIKGKKVFIHLDELWFMQYEYIVDDGCYKYGLRLKYANTGTIFKYIFQSSEGFKTELDMKKAIKTDVSKWLLETQKKYNIKEIPVGQVQELVHKQLKLF